MDPEPYIITGMMIGTILTLAVQMALRWRKASKIAAAKVENEVGTSSNERQLLIDQQDRMYSAMLRLEERISVIERISTENEGTAGRLSKEIESLRR